MELHSVLKNLREQTRWVALSTARTPSRIVSEKNYFIPIRDEHAVVRQLLAETKHAKLLLKTDHPAAYKAYKRCKKIRRKRPYLRSKKTQKLLRVELGMPPGRLNTNICWQNLERRRVLSWMAMQTVRGSGTNVMPVQTARRPTLARVILYQRSKVYAPPEATTLVTGPQVFN